MHLVKRHLELLLHKQPVFSEHQPRPSSLRLVRYLGVVPLVHLEPLQPSRLQARSEPLGNNNLPQVLVLARASLVEVLRSASLNSNNPLRLVRLANLSSSSNNNNNNNNNRLQAPVLISSVVQTHSDNQSLLQDLEAPSVNQVGALVTVVLLFV